MLVPEYEWTVHMSLWSAHVLKMKCICQATFDPKVHVPFTSAHVLFHDLQYVSIYENTDIKGQLLEKSQCTIIGIFSSVETMLYTVYNFIWTAMTDRDKNLTSCGRQKLMLSNSCVKWWQYFLFVYCDNGISNNHKIYLYFFKDIWTFFV